MHRVLVAVGLCAVAALGGVPAAGFASGESQRCGMWIDLYSGEPVRYEEMLDDLGSVRIVYIGERHTLVRHHGIQEQIISDLAARGVKLAVALEMLPAVLQPTLDEYNLGQLSFDELADSVVWEDVWNNYEQYRGVVEAARSAGAPVLALNAEGDLVSEVAKKGLAGLDSAQAERLPPEMNTDQPAYERELARVMMVMAHVTGDADMLRRMFEAQITRDETMARTIVRYLGSADNDGRTVVVLCGSGHVAYGYGVPSRVRSRTGDLADRIVVLSESGDVVLTEREQAMARTIEITHAQLRENTVPYADYLHATSLAPEASEPDTSDSATAIPTMEAPD